MAKGDLGSILAGAYTKIIKVTPTLTVHATYISGDYVGTSAVPMTFDGAARDVNGTGVVISASLDDYATQSVAGELWLFTTAVTPPADSAAWSISDADSANCIGVIPFNVYYASALNSHSDSGAVFLSFQCADQSKALYGCFVTRGTPTYADGDLTFRLCISQD